MRASLSLLLVPLALFAGVAHAQLDPGFRVSVLQDRVERGQVYTPADQPRCEYDEYWFLYEDFQFLDIEQRNGWSTEVAGKAGDLDGWLKEMWDAHPRGRLFVAHSVESGPSCR